MEFYERSSYKNYSCRNYSCDKNDNLFTFHFCFFVAAIVFVFVVVADTVRSNWHLFMWDEDKFLLSKRTENKTSNKSLLSADRKKNKRKKNGQTKDAKTLCKFSMLSYVGPWANGWAWKTGTLQSLSYDGSTFECVIFQLGRTD